MEGPEEIGTYTIIRANATNVNLFLVNQPPHNPFSSRFHPFHLLLINSALFSRFAAFVMFRSSDFCHSGPRVGTVTISTGPAELGSSPFASGVEICLYLSRKIRQPFPYDDSIGNLPCFALAKRIAVLRASVIKIGVHVPTIVLVQTSISLLVQATLQRLLSSGIKEGVAVVASRTLTAIQKVDVASGKIGVQGIERTFASVERGHGRLPVRIHRIYNTISV
jgi:hypothetical protein